MTASLALFFHRAPQTPDHLGAPILIGLPAHLVIDIEEQLRQIIVPIEARHLLRRQTAGRLVVDLSGT